MTIMLTLFLDDSSHNARGEVPLILSTYSQICLLVHIQRDRDTERDTYTERERERVENKCA